MKMEGTIYCDGPDCECHSTVGSDRAKGMTFTSLPPGFLRVVEYGSHDDQEFGFCSLDCLMKWAAKFPPPEIIEAGDVPDA